MRTYLAGLGGLLAWLGTSLIAGAAAPVTAPHVRVSLLSEQKNIQPGRSFSIGVDFQLEDGWHIYWQNAGDSGEGPQIRWKLPAGFKVGDLAWPVPSRLSAPPLVNYGYENHVLLTALAQAPETAALERVGERSSPSTERVGERSSPSAQSRTTIELGASVRWLVCREVCIPGKAEITRVLPIGGASGRPVQYDAETKPFFDEARANLPRPAPSSWKAEVLARSGGFWLRVTGDPRLQISARSAVFFPLDADQLDNAAPQSPQPTADGLELKLQRSDQLSTRLEHLRGVLALKLGASDSAIQLDMPVLGDAIPAAAALSPVQALRVPEPQHLLWVLVFAFVGGLILNLMPCVFPILSIKVLSLVRTSGKQRAHLRMHGFVYTAGILVSFWVLVGTLIVLKAGGRELGWGFQLQSPSFVACLALFLFAFALNLAGVFEFGSSFAGVGENLTREEGLKGSFFTGVLATVVATPCTAPFMGSAIGFALSQGAVTSFLVFTLLGLGLAAPYLLLSFEPSLSRVLPRPGRWMETLKQMVSFPVFATVLWLAWVFGMQAGMESLFRLLVSLLVVGCAAWVVGHWASSVYAQLVAVLLIAASIAFSLSGANVATDSATAGGVAKGDGVTAPTRSVGRDRLEWERFVPEKIDSYRRAGRPVFVDFTAAWCVSCKVNELLVFSSDEVKSELHSRNFVMMKADWTTYDPVITRSLADFGRSGVPLYVIYPADRAREPLVLPEIINSGIVLRGLRGVNG